MSKLTLKEDDTLTVVTYGRNPEAPDLYVTVPQAGWGAIIRFPHTIEVMAFGGPQMLLDIGFTMVCSEENEGPEEAYKVGLCAEHFDLEYGPLSQETIAEFQDVVSYSEVVLSGPLILDVTDDAVTAVPDKPEGMKTVEA